MDPDGPSVPSQFTPSSLLVHSKFTARTFPIHGPGRTMMVPDGPGLDIPSIYFDLGTYLKPIAGA